MKELKGMSSEEHQRIWGWSSLEKRKLKGDLVDLHNFLRRASGEDGADVFSLVSSLGGVGIVQSCSGGGSEWTLGSISLLRGWSCTVTGFLGRWSKPQDSQCFRAI